MGGYIMVVLEDKEFYTTGDISRWCETPYITILSWIRKGKIISNKTPGGHHRIIRDDFIAFLTEYGYPLPESLCTYKRDRILIADDDELVIDLLRQGLEEEYEVVTAANGFYAAMAIVEHRPNLIILDIDMPGINGIDICKHLKARENTMRIKIIGITGTELAVELLKAGANDCMHKPIDIDELRHRVKTLLEPR